MKPTSDKLVAYAIHRWRSALRRTAYALLLGLAGLPDAAHAQVYGPEHGHEAHPAPSFQSSFGTPLPGNVWFGFTGADQGLGYEGSFFTLGSLFPLFDDAVGGTWFVEARAHVSEQARSFANLGIGRRHYLDPIMLGISGWYDFDDDRAEEFGHAFHQFGVSGEIVGNGWAARMNGYFPFGETDHMIGSVENCFVGNQFVIQRGFDTALTGFDAEIGLPVPYLDHLAATINLGGYTYGSEAVDRFGGFSARLDISPLEQVGAQFAVTHDDHFQTTGFASVVFRWGGSRRLNAVDAMQQPTQRNSHIVRGHQNAIFASNPDNADELWAVYHVDNTAPAGGDGSFEDPFNTLAAAEAAANSPFDIIFVREGDGTTTGYDTGITLDARQLLLGDGVRHLVNTQAGLFELCSDMDGFRPTITNPTGPAVTLDDGNVVAGFNIVAAQTGIFGDGIEDALIRDNVIRNSTTHGVFFLDSTGEIVVEDNTLTDNGLGTGNGLRVENTTGQVEVTVRGNDIRGNGHGIFLSTTGLGTTMNALIEENIAISNNLGNGINIEATDFSELNFMILDNPAINRNGRETDTGTGIELFAEDSTMTGIIEGNTIAENAGSPELNPVSEASAVRGVFTADSNIDLELNRNLILGRNPIEPGGADPAGIAIRLGFDINNTMINRVVLDENRILRSESHGFFLSSSDLTVLDLIVTDNTITDSYHNAIRLVAADDSVVRFTLERNDIRGSDDPTSPAAATDNAVDIRSIDRARLIAFVTDNIIDSNGVAPNANGFQATSENEAELVLEITNNALTNNGENGIALFVLDTSTMVALVRNNNMTNNGATQDFLAEIDAAATLPASLCLELTENLTTDGFQLNNLGTLTTFEFEDGGGNTGLIMTTGPITPVPPGTCEAMAAPLQVFP